MRLGANTIWCTIPVGVKEPTLQGPLTSRLDHEYWMRQHLQVSLRTSAGKLINVYNVHSPGSNKHPLTPTVRADILEWFATNAAKPALIGGDLKSSLPSLDAGFKNYGDIHYCYEKNHLQGDVVIAKGLEAQSMPCEVMLTSKLHKMCVVMAAMELDPPKLSPAPRLEASSSAEKRAKAALPPPLDKPSSYLSVDALLGSSEKPAQAALPLPSDKPSSYSSADALLGSAEKAC